MSFMRNPVVAALLATSSIVTLALLWFGWRTIEQERHLEVQRTRELLERAADTAAAGVRAKLAEASELLAKGEAVAGAIVVTQRQGSVIVTPHGTLPFVPALELSSIQEKAFTDGERLEFGSETMSQAVEAYRNLSIHGDPGIRAGALLRLGRTLRKLGRETEAMATFASLSKLGNVIAGGLPAELVGLDGQKLIHEIADGVGGGRWLLARGAAEFYFERDGGRAKPRNWRLAEALSEVWGKHGILLTEHGDVRSLAMWRTHANGSSALVAEADTFIQPHVPTGYRFALLRDFKNDGGAARTLGDASNPWMLRLWAEGNQKFEGGGALLVGMLTMVIVFLWATVYLMARALRREAQTARLQNDFVASVSHEFRSPLTTMRQLAEMLEMDRVANDERRKKYYQVLSSEARRLQRLVETLLNFGKLEAGAQPFRFEVVDVAHLVERALADADSAERVIVREECTLAVSGDKEALTVAVRNLVENALKYSPASEPVEVRFGSRDGKGFLDVVDRGEGIPKEEQKAVFEKFVRGRTAISGNVKGTGIGLAIVKQIMQAHGGEVRLKSDTAQGATFTLIWNEAR